METYEQKCKDAQKWIEGIYAELSHERQMEAEGLFPELKESNRGDTRKELLTFLDELSKLGKGMNFDRWSTSDVANWIAWVQKQDPTWFEEELEKAYINGYEDAKREILGLADIESMAESFRQRLTNQCNSADNRIVDMCVKSFKHGVNCILDELHLKQCQVKESDISQHETKTCEEINDSLTSEDERIRREIEQFLKQHNGWNKEWLAWLEKQGDFKEKPTRDQVWEYCSKISHEWWQMVMDKWNTLTYEEQSKYNQFIGFNDFSDMLMNITAGALFQLRDTGKLEYEEGSLLLEKPDDTPKPIEDVACIRPTDKVEQKSVEEINGNIEKVSPIWSEEDEKIMNELNSLIDTLFCKGGISINLYKKYHNWLKSLKERVQSMNSWKPHIEQIEAFEHFYRSMGESGFLSPYDSNTQLLYSLLLELRKLKKE